MKFIALTQSSVQGTKKILISLRQIVAIEESLDGASYIRCRNGDSPIIYKVQESILKITEYLEEK